MRQKEPLRISQHRHRLGKVVENSPRLAGHVDSVQVAELDQRRICAKHSSILTSDGRVVALFVVFVVVDVVDDYIFRRRLRGLEAQDPDSFVFRRCVGILFLFLLVVVVVVVVVVVGFVVEKRAGQSARSVRFRPFLFVRLPLELLPHHGKKGGALEHLVRHSFVPSGAIGRVPEQLDGGVVCSFDSVVAEAAVAHQLEALCRDSVSGSLCVVSSLQDGFQKVLGVV